MNVRITDRFVAQPIEGGPVFLFLDGKAIIDEDGGWVAYPSVPAAALTALTWFPHKLLFDMSDRELMDAMHKAHELERVIAGFA